MYTSMYVHAGTQKCGDMEHRTWPELIINAASQKQAGSNAQLSTHLKSTVHVCQTFITCHRTQSLNLFFHSYPSLNSQSICLFWENMWEAERVKRRESQQEQISIACFNIMVIKLRGGGKASVCGYMSISWVFMWVCGLIYVSKWWCISDVLRLCLQWKPIVSCG